MSSSPLSSPDLSLDPSPDLLQAWHWHGDALELLDQRRLPQATEWVVVRNAQDAAEAIRNMVVRGAPAIGMTASFALVLQAQILHAEGEDWRDLAEAREVLAASRPTAVNLFWALEQMDQALQTAQSPADLLAVAEANVADDLAANRAIGDAGAALIAAGSGVYTHCNTGSLATAGYGTALGVIRSAWREQRLARVYAGETRPWLQGARLTAYELLCEQIPFKLCADGAAGSLFAHGQVDWVIVGADRISAAGDVANKIGTYNLAVLAAHHGKKFMVAAHTSTIDWNCLNGAEIPIEQRPAEEVAGLFGHPIAPPGTPAYNPAFDVTPASLVSAIVTERGVIESPTVERMAQLKK